MDTPTLPFNQPKAIYKQLPADRGVLAWDKWLRKNNWRMKPFSMYYNTLTMQHENVQELYKLFKADR